MFSLRFDIGCNVDYKATMGEALYPSGPWTGFYTYSPSDKHRMDLNLEFHEGSIVGDGIDDVGRFLVRGSYDAAEGECRWVKTYPGSHNVYYRGFREGKGIWGTWDIELGAAGHGGFHIWPKSMSDADCRQEHQAEPVAVSNPEISPANRPIAPKPSFR